MALRAANRNEDPLVARAFSRPCRHSCRHVFSRVFKGFLGYPKGQNQPPPAPPNSLGKGSLKDNGFR